MGGHGEIEKVGGREDWGYEVGVCGGNGRGEEERVGIMR